MCVATVEKATTYAEKTTRALKQTKLSYAGALMLDVDGNNLIDSNDAIQLYIAVAMRGFGAVQFLTTFQSKLSHTAKQPGAIVEDVARATSEFNSDHPVQTFTCTCKDDTRTFKLTYGTTESDPISCGASRDEVEAAFKLLLPSSTVTFATDISTACGVNGNTMTFDFNGGAATIAVTETTKGVAAVSEVQTAVCVATSGTFKLAYGGQETAALAFDASTSDVQTAFAGLSSVTSATVTFSTGSVACAASPGVGIIITFTASGDNACSKFVDCALRSVFDQTKTSAGTAICPVPSSFSYSTNPSPDATSGFSDLEVSVDTMDTVDDAFTVNKKPYFHHKMNYTAHGPYPKIAPLVGTSKQHLIIDPSDLHDTIALSDLGIRAFLGTEVMVASSREDHRVIIVHNFQNLLPLHDFVVSVTFDSTTAVSKGTLASTCTDLRMWDADYYSELDVWVRPGTCNSTQTVVYVKIPQIKANATQELLMSYGNSTTRQDGNTTFTRDASAHTTSFSNGLFEDYTDAAWVGTPSPCISEVACETNALALCTKCPLWVFPTPAVGDMLEFAQSTSDGKVLRVKHLVDGATFVNSTTSPYFKKYIRSRMKFNDDIAAESVWTRPEIGGQQFFYISKDEEAILLPPPDKAAAAGVSASSVFIHDTATMLWTRDTDSQYNLQIWGMDGHGIRFNASKTCVLANTTEHSVSVRVVRSGISLQVGNCTVASEQTVSSASVRLPSGPDNVNCTSTWQVMSEKSSLPATSYADGYQMFMANGTAIRHSPGFTRIRDFALFAGAFHGAQNASVAAVAQSYASMFKFLFVRPALPDAAHEPVAVMQPEMNYWRVQFPSTGRSVDNNVLRVAWNSEMLDSQQFSEPAGAPLLQFSQSGLAAATVAPPRALANAAATFNISTSAGMTDLNANMDRSYQEAFARTHGLRCSTGLDICRATSSCNVRLESLGACGGNSDCIATAMQAAMDQIATDDTIEADVFALLNTPERCAVDMECLKYHSLEKGCAQSGVVGYQCFKSAAQDGKCKADLACYEGLKQCSGAVNAAVCPNAFVTSRASALSALLSGTSRCLGSSSFAVKLQSSVMFCTPPYLNSAACEFMPSPLNPVIAANAIEPQVAFNGIDFLKMPGATLSMYNARFFSTTSLAGPLYGDTLLEFDVEMLGFEAGHTLTGRTLYFKAPDGSEFQADGVDVTPTTAGSTECSACAASSSPLACIENPGSSACTIAKTQCAGESCERRTVQFRVPAREGVEALVDGTYEASVIGLALSNETANATAMKLVMIGMLQKEAGCNDISIPESSRELCEIPLSNVTIETDYETPRTAEICSEVPEDRYTCCSSDSTGSFHSSQNKSKAKLTLKSRGLMKSMLRLQAALSVAAAAVAAQAGPLLNPMRWCSFRPVVTRSPTPARDVNVVDDCPPNSHRSVELCPATRITPTRPAGVINPRPLLEPDDTSMYTCYRPPAAWSASINGVTEHIPGACMANQTVLTSAKLMPVIKTGLHSLSMALLGDARVQTGLEFQFYDPLQVFDGLPMPRSAPSETDAEKAPKVTYSGPGEELHLSMKPTVKLSAPSGDVYLTSFLDPITLAPAATAAAVLNPELRDGKAEVPRDDLAIGSVDYVGSPRLLTSSQKFQSLYLADEDAPFSVVLSGESYQGLLLKFVRTRVAKMTSNLYDVHIRYATIANKTKLALCPTNSSALPLDELSAPVPSEKLTELYGPGIITAAQVQRGMTRVEGDCDDAAFCYYSWISLPLKQKLVWPTGQNLLLEIEYRTTAGLKSSRDFNLGLSRLMDQYANRTVWNMSTADAVNTPRMGFAKPQFDSKGRDASIPSHFVPQIQLQTNAVKLTAKLPSDAGSFTMDIAPNGQQYVGRWTQLNKQTSAGIKAAVQLTGLTKEDFGIEQQFHFTSAMYTEIKKNQEALEVPSDDRVQLDDIKIMRIGDVGSGGRRRLAGSTTLYVEFKVSTARQSSSSTTHATHAKTLAQAVVPPATGDDPPFLAEVKQLSQAAANGGADPFAASKAVPVKLVDTVEIGTVEEMTDVDAFEAQVQDEQAAFTKSKYAEPIDFKIFKQRGILVGQPAPASGPVSWLTVDGVVQKTEVRIPLTGAAGVITNGSIVTVRWFVGSSTGSSQTFADSVGVAAGPHNATIVTRAPDMTGLMSASDIKQKGYMQTEIRISFNYHEGGDSWTNDKNSFSFYMVPQIYGLRMISSETPNYNSPLDLEPCKVIDARGAEQEYAVDTEGNQLLDASQERVKFRGEVVNIVSRECALPAMKTTMFVAPSNVTDVFDGLHSAASIGGYPYKGYNRVPQSGKNPGDFAGCCEFDVNGTATKCGAGPCNQVYVFINATNVWYRKNKLVCRFATGETGIGAIPYLYRAAAGITHSKFVFGLSEVKCPVPPLSSAGILHAVDFSVNAGISDEDHAMWADGILPIKIEAMPCPEGYVAPLPSMQCSRCTPGTYQASKLKCEACDLGEYQDLSGQLSCKKCPKYSSTSGIRGASSLSACSCDPGYYTEFGADNVADCKPCPKESAVCLGGINLPFAKEGYVNHATLGGSNSWQGGMHATVTMQRCSPPTACPGGMGNTICGAQTKFKCSPCSQGYAGFKCSECAAEHYRLSHYCVGCPTQDFIIGLFYLQIVLYFLAVVLFCNDRFFEYVSKVASIQIFIRFLQVTFCLCYYELAWAGGAKKQWITDEYGALNEEKSADTEVHAMKWIGIFKLASHLMPAFFFPNFGQTAGLECVSNHWAAGKKTESLFAFGIPFLVLLVKWIAWASKYRPQLLIESYYRVVRFVEGLTVGGRGRSDVARSRANAGSTKTEMLGDKQRDRVLAMAVGLWVMMTPYIMREILTAITCSADTIGAACTASSDSQENLMLVLMLTLFMGWVFLFLDQPYQRRHFFFLCKNKKKVSKNWEFWTQLRMTMLVFSTFASDNGVFQAGLGLTVILAVLASQSFKKPYKDERSNLLEVFCLLVNISMLFLGIVASIGSLESKSMAAGAQAFGIFCFMAAIFGSVYTMVGECADRGRLNASKSGAAGDSAKISKHEEKEDQCLIDFVSQVMDIVIPKTRWRCNLPHQCEPAIFGHRFGDTRLETAQELQAEAQQRERG
jgi:hypothetical protein